MINISTCVDSLLKSDSSSISSSLPRRLRAVESFHHRRPRTKVKDQIIPPFILLNTSEKVMDGWWCLNNWCIGEVWVYVLGRGRGGDNIGLVRTRIWRWSESRAAKGHARSSWRRRPATPAISLRNSTTDPFHFCSCCPKLLKITFMFKVIAYRP